MSSCIVSKIRRKKIGLALLLITLLNLPLLSGCARSAELPFEIVRYHDHSGYVGPRAYFIAATEDEAVIPGQRSLSLKSQPADFETQFIIAAFYGVEASGGYGIEITQVSQVGDVVTVQVLIEEYRLKSDRQTSTFCLVYVDKAPMPKRGNLTFVFIDMEGEEILRTQHYIP